MFKRLFKDFPIPLPYVFALAFALSLIIFLQILLPYVLWDAMDEFNWYKTLIPTFLNFLFWALLSPFVYLLLRRCAQWGTLIVLLLSIGMAVAHELITTLASLGVLQALGQTELVTKFWNHMGSSLVVGTLSSFLQLWISIAIFYAAETQQKYQQKQREIDRLEKDLTEAQLNALKMQLQPHFLFNALHTILSLIVKNTADAQKVTAQLGDLLRAVLAEAPEQTTPLKKELAFIQNYLGIEQMRFHDRLQIHYRIAPETETALVPGLILQPLVENAVKHGFSKQSGRGTITITSARINGRLRLTVEDDGAGLKNPRQPVQFGIGLQNVRERLQRLYHDQSAFTLNPAQTRGTIASITLPFETATGESTADD